MQKQAAIDLVEGMIGNVQQKMVSEIKEGRVPEGWNGVELQWWISDRMKSVVHNSRHIVDHQARHKDYINDRLIGGF